MTINWISINDQYPTEHKEYLVQFNEFIGITVIIGWKITYWDGNFSPANRQIVTHFADVPDYIRKQ
jgi:hypothetical protein